MRRIIVTLTDGHQRSGSADHEVDHDGVEVTTSGCLHVRAADGTEYLYASGTWSKGTVIDADRMAP